MSSLGTALTALINGSMVLTGKLCGCVTHTGRLAWDAASADPEATAARQAKADAAAQQKELKARQGKKKDDVEEDLSEVTAPPVAPVRRPALEALGVLGLGGALVAGALSAAWRLVSPEAGQWWADMEPYRYLIITGAGLAWMAAAWMVSPPPPAAKAAKGAKDAKGGLVDREDVDQEDLEQDVLEDVDGEWLTVDDIAAMVRRVAARHPRHLGVHLSDLLPEPELEGWEQAELKVALGDDWGLPVSSIKLTFAGGHARTRDGVRLEHLPAAPATVPGAVGGSAPGGAGEGLALVPAQHPAAASPEHPVEGPAGTPSGVAVGAAVGSSPSVPAPHPPGVR